MVVKNAMTHLPPKPATTNFVAGPTLCLPMKKYIYQIRLNYSFRFWPLLVRKKREKHKTHVLDYAGYRLTAATSLPLDKADSLMYADAAFVFFFAPYPSYLLSYGSEDAGRSVHWDEEAHSIALKIGQDLKLRPHICAGKEVALCADFEIHKSGEFFYALGNFFFCLRTEEFSSSYIRN